jgi:phytoene dehydrogenase-like protein
MKSIYDYVIIGAGASGLGISALLNKRGFNVLTLEAHYYAGGSSSYFFRDGHLFDAGATTLSGLKENGPLARFLNQSDIVLPTKKIDPGLISLINNKKIKRFSNLDLFRNEIVTAFPDLHQKDLTKFLINLHSIEIDGYKTIQENYLPIRSLIDFTNLIKIQNLNKLGLIPLLFKDFFSLIPDSLKKNESFLNLMNEILFITSQNNISDTPALMGALGFQYPTDTHYCMGGMKTFVDLLKTKVPNLKVSTKVLKIEKNNNEFSIFTNKEIFKSKNIISTLPIWNNNQLMPSNKKIQITPKIDINQLWSAFTLYFTVPDSLKIESLYYQVHTEQIIHAKTKSYFVSFSDPEDLDRNKKNRLTVTISTHIKPLIFEHLSREEYIIRKNEIQNFIIKNFIEKFELQNTDIENLESGTSKTFEHFTNRYQGLVGGIPHSIGRPLKEILFANENLPGFYHLGDTSFPGQGIAAVIYGALTLDHFLSKL